MDQQTNPKPLEEEASDNIQQDQNVSEASANTEETVNAAEEPVEAATEESVKAATEEPAVEPIAEETTTESTPAEAPKAANGPVYKTMEELDLLEKEYSDAEFETLSKLYEDTLVDFKPGQVVMGKILSVNDKEVSIDIGFKSEGQSCLWMNLEIRLMLSLVMTLKFSLTKLKIRTVFWCFPRKKPIL